MVCDLLEVSTSGYFAHLRRRGADKPSKPGANRRISNEALLVHIRAIHAEVRGEYGWPKMWKELVARGIRVGKEVIQHCELWIGDDKVYEWQETYWGSFGGMGAGWWIEQGDTSIDFDVQALLELLDLLPEPPEVPKPESSDDD